MSAPARAIRSICIAGAGPVGLGAALAFARALPMARVTLIDCGADPAALADRLCATLPVSRAFHAAMGIGERDLIAAGAATPCLGTRFSGWSACGEDWTLSFGEHGLAASGVAFHHLWVRARQAGEVLPFDRFALGAVLGNAGRFVHPRYGSGTPLARFDYRLRLDPPRYAALLEARLATLPVDRLTAPVASVERRDDGGVAALLLADSERVEADLFLDCSGPAAVIASKMGTAHESWCEWLPVDRIALSETSDRCPAPLDTLIARGGGWTRTVPHIDRAQMLEARVSALTPAKANDGVPIRPGRLSQPWTANVLALGDAAIVPDPALGLELTLAHMAVLRALELLAGRDCHPVEIAEYNRRTADEALRVRDLGIAMMQAGPFAVHSHAALPASIGLTLDQFATRGRLPFFEEELFDTDGWLALLLGTGQLPRAPDPIVGSVDPSAAAAGMGRLADDYAVIAERALPFADYLAQMRAAA
jgi:tryptophan 7-halogenase